MNFAEELFHRVFGTRGISGTELETAGARRDLQSLYEKLTARLGSLSEGRRANAIALSTEMSRHLLTYPETPSELVNWNTTALRLTREARKYIGLSPVIVGLLIGGSVVAALGIVIVRSRRQR